MTAPEGIGSQLPMPDHRGWLTFDALPDDLRRAEDSTRWCDYESPKLVRPVTATELVLLEHLGYDTSPVTQTVCRHRNRSWPVLEATPRTPEERKILRSAGYTDALPQ